MSPLGLILAVVGILAFVFALVQASLVMAAIGLLCLLGAALVH